jgi:LDH2 family malate/lactate/ureidoglycolate dehydrogenase
VSYPDPAVQVLDPSFGKYRLGLAAVERLSRRPGVEEIRVPSERAFRERERRRIEGLVCERKVVEALHALASS